MNGYVTFQGSGGDDPYSQVASLGMLLCRLTRSSIRQAPAAVYIFNCTDLFIKINHQQINSVSGTGSKIRRNG